MPSLDVHSLYSTALGSTRALASHVSEHRIAYIGATLALFWYLLYKNYLYARYFSPLRVLPGPPDEHPILGNFKTIIADEPGVVGPVNRWHKQYGPRIRFLGAFGRERVSFSTRSALKQILVDEPYNFPKPAFIRNLLGIVAGYGLLTLEDKPHQDMRRFMNNAFAMKYLQQQFELYHGPVNGLVGLLNEKITAAPNEPIEVSELISATLLDVICSTAFGYKIDSLHNKDEPLAVAYHHLVNLQGGPALAFIIFWLTMPGGVTSTIWLTSQRFTGPFFSKLAKIPGPLSGAAKMLGDFCTHLYTVRSIAKQLLDEKLAEARKLKEAGAPFDSGRIDVLSLLVKASQDENSTYRMREEDLCHQVLTFLGAGHETTASGTTWALYELARHPEVQEKLHKECAELRAHSANPDYQEIKELKYLDAFVNEVLRLRPPTPATGRSCKRDCTVDGVFLPKGTTLWIPNITVNCNAEEWGPDGEEFRPERWLTMDKSAPKLMTFIQGAHHCIGKTMAQQEMLVLICALSAHFKFELPTPDYKAVATAAITMKTRDGLMLRVSKREGLAGV